MKPFSPQRADDFYKVAGGTRPASRRGTWLFASAAALTGAALLVRKRAREAEEKHPPVGRFLEVDGVRLHYMERGKGQPLVLLHGGGSMIEDFQASGLIEMAAAKYRVIAFDRPGYGYSERPRTSIWTPQAQARLLRQAMQQLGVDQPIVLGHSWGALVAVALALDFPDDIKSLVLLSGYYYPTPRADVPLLASPSIPLLGDLMRHTITPLLGRLAWPWMRRRLFSPARVTENFRSGFPVEMALRPTQLRATAAEIGLMIPSTFSMRGRYHEMVLPVVMMSGDGDLNVDMHEQSERLHRELPQSSFHVVRGAGHMVHHTAPYQVMKAIDHAATAEGAVPGIAYQYVFPAPAQVV